MPRKIITLLFSITIWAGMSVGQMATDLPAAVEQANTLLAARTDSAACRELAATLVQLSEEQPASEYTPAVVLAAARLEEKIGHSTQAVKTAERLWMSYPASPLAKDAFDFAWNIETRQGQSPLAGAKLALSMAAAQGSNTTARFYYRKAFDIYRQNDWWRSAADAGQDYLTHCARSTPDAELMMALAAVALKAGDTDLAARSYREFTALFPNLPLVVTAYAGLGSIHAAAGQSETAADYNSRAWTIYQKNRKKSEYNQHEITQAAAQALWALQTDARRAFESQTLPDRAVGKNLLREAAVLEEAYRQVMLTDPEMAPQAFLAIGDLRMRLGDALLAEGFRAAIASASPVNAVPYEAALPEYERAEAAYSMAWERASLVPEDAQARQIVHRAAESAFETAVGQGDALIAWSVELMKYAPTRQPGEAGCEPRFQFVTNRVAPLAREAVATKTAAFALTQRMPVMALAEQIRPGLDSPLRVVAGEMYALCGEEMRAVTKGASQLAGLQTMGFQSMGQTSLVQSLENDFARMTRMNSAASPVLLDLYAAGTAHCQPGAERPYWDSLLVGFYSEYAAVCQSLQSDMTTALASLSREDEETAPLRAHLNRLQTQAASQEYAGLVDWYRWSGEYDVHHPANKEMTARLAKLDPLNYGNPYDLPSASRKGP
ncbi:MAG: tetratricopeptide repeat protein [bacterium]|nr:tetratricopeptide repeat protein [bacterium]